MCCAVCVVSCANELCTARISGSGVSGVKKNMTWNMACKKSEESERSAVR